MKIGEQTIVFLAVNKNGDEVILNNAPARQGEIWTDERSAHDDEYFSVEDHNKSVIEELLHVDIEFYKQKIINFVKWI